MAWTLVAKIAVLIVLQVVSNVLRDKPDGPSPGNLKDFDIPTADESRPIPVVFGTVLVKGSNVVWYGDLKTKKIKKSGGKK